MFKITSIEPQKNNPKRFNIFLDGEFAFGADEDLVVNQRLVPGKIIQHQVLDTLLFEAEVGKLMERMYGLFSVRQRSEKEIRDYFKNLSFKRKIKNQEEISGLTIDVLIERLKQKGMINDLEFAKDWVVGRRRSKKEGINALKSELYQKGIKREIIEEIFNDQFSIIEEKDLAERALEKKIRIWKNLDKQTFKKKAIDYLLRKGFEYEMIKKLVEKNIEKRYTTNSEIKNYEDDF